MSFNAIITWLEHFAVNPCFSCENLVVQLVCVIFMSSQMNDSFRALGKDCEVIVELRFAENRAHNMHPASSNQIETMH